MATAASGFPSAQRFPYKERRANLAFDADVLLVTALANVRYLCGFTGSNAVLLVERGGRALLFTDPRYETQAPKECDCPVRIVRRGGLFAAAAAAIQRKKLLRVGFERTRIPWVGWESMRMKLPTRVELIPVDQAVEQLRMVKDDHEVAAIRRSVMVNSQAFDRAFRNFRSTMTESDLAAELDHQMRRLGASEPAFETIVASGAQSALPHARPGARPIQVNQVLLVDMGASVGGYASDMTRTMAVGRISREMKRMYQATLEAQLAGIDAVRPGVTAAEVDSTARRVLKKHGLSREFIHSTGHGLGLEIHEMPRLGKNDATRLTAGMVVTIEPGVYRPEVGGVRIEDTVLVTESGCEVLTPTPKQLVSI